MTWIKKHRDKILIFSSFILLSLVATYPLIFRMQSYLYGLGGDALSSVSTLWRIKYTHLNPSVQPLIGYPYSGLNVAYDVPNILWNSLVIPLTFLANEIFACNFVILVSFFLSAIMTYYLVYHFTKSKLASMVSGVIYTFCPYHFAHSCHLVLANIQWMPLYALALFRLGEERSYKSALFCALAFSLTLLFHFQYGYCISIFTVAFVVWRMWQAVRGKNRGQVSRWESEQVRKRETEEGRNGETGKVSRQAIKTDRRTDGQIDRQGDRSPIIYRSPFKTVRVVLVAVVVAVAIILPSTYPIFKTVLFVPENEEIMLKEGYVRPFEDLFIYSAQLFHYLIPSGDNPLIGSFTRNFIKVYHPIEQTLYLGWVGIVLSLIAVRDWRRKNRKQVRKWESGQVSKEQGAEAIKISSNQAIEQSRIEDPGSRIQKGVSFFLFAGVVAWIFSHAPWTEIGPFRIFFPSYFMYKMAPMFRCYARFGILVMLSVSVLAGIGLASLLKKIKTPKKRVDLVIAVFLLIFIEFAPTFPAPMVNAVDPPPVYEWLSKQEGDFIIAEYPIETDYEYLFWQRIHQKRLVNGARPGTYADKIRKEIVDILNPETPGILSYLGAKYLIFHPEKYAKSDEVKIIREIPNIKRQPGLKLVRTFPEARVYEIIAEPIQPRGL